MKCAHGNVKEYDSNLVSLTVGGVHFTCWTGIIPCFWRRAYHHSAVVVTDAGVPGNCFSPRGSVARSGNRKKGKRAPSGTWGTSPSDAGKPHLGRCYGRIHATEAHSLPGSTGCCTAMKGTRSNWSYRRGSNNVLSSWHVTCLLPGNRENPSPFDPMVLLARNKSTSSQVLCLLSRMSVNPAQEPKSRAPSAYAHHLGAL